MPKFNIQNYPRLLLIGRHWFCCRRLAVTIMTIILIWNSFKFSISNEITIFNYLCNKYTITYVEIASSRRYIIFSVLILMHLKKKTGDLTISYHYGGIHIFMFRPAMNFYIKNVIGPTYGSSVTLDVWLESELILFLHILSSVNFLQDTFKMSIYNNGSVCERFKSKCL